MRNTSESTIATLSDIEQMNEAITTRIEQPAALNAFVNTREEERSERENDMNDDRNSAFAVASSKILNLVKLRVGGVFFEVKREILLRVPNTYFHGMLSSGAWNPEADGAYFVDRPALGFDRILEYLRSGKLSVEGLTNLEEEYMYNSLDYLLIPYKKQWNYNMTQICTGFIAYRICELKDGRLCGAVGFRIVVWNLGTLAVDMIMIGHLKTILRIIQLHDGRVCSCSVDETIKLWNIDSGLCEHSFTGHAHAVLCIVQLYDGRLCSSSYDMTLKIWNISTGICEMTINTHYSAQCIMQLQDSRICCGENDASISLYNVLTGECEISWHVHTNYIFPLICIGIDSSRICSGSSDKIIVWNTDTGECERTLKGHTARVNSMVLMQDGRLCSACENGSIKLWNLETGESATLTKTKKPYIKSEVLQLADGRIVACGGYEAVRLIY